MEDETFFAKIVHAAVFLAICVAIIFVGWREPLRYRFMSQEDIISESQPFPSQEGDEQPKWLRDKITTSRLEESPRYRAGKRGVIRALPFRKADGLEPPPDRGVKR